MKSSTDQEKRQNSLKQKKNRRAAFVTYEFKESETFKYHSYSKIKLGLRNGLINWKRRFKSVFQGLKLRTNKIDWSKMIKDLLEWLIEASIEGIVANFATHYLLKSIAIDMPFDAFTVLAHGFAIKQGISIYWRLRRDGPATKLYKKDE